MSCKQSLDSEHSDSSLETKLEEEEEEDEKEKEVRSASLLFGRNPSVLPAHPISRPQTNDQSIASIHGINSMAASTSIPMQFNESWPLPIEGLMSRLPRNSSSIALERHMAAEYMRRRQLNLACAFATNPMPSPNTRDSLGSHDTGLSRLPDLARAVQGSPAAAAAAAGFPENPTASPDRALKTVRRPSATGSAASPERPVKKARRSPPGTPSSRRRILPMSKKNRKRQASTTSSASSSSSRRLIANDSEMVFDLSIQEQRRSGVPRPGRSIIEFHPHTLRRDWDRLECRTDALDDTPSDQSRLVSDLFSRRLCQLPAIDLPDRLDCSASSIRKKTGPGS